MYSIKLNVNFLILLIYALVQICCGSVPAKNLSCADDKELDRQCETYCYRVVKPLLQHASDVYLKEQELTKLLAKVQQHENINKSIQVDQAILQAKVDAQNLLLTSYNDLLAAKNGLIENKNSRIKELETKQENITKTMQVVQHNFQAKVDAQNHSLTSCKGQLAEKDALIENKNADIKELETKQENITKTMQVVQHNFQAKVDAQNHSLTSCKSQLAEKDALIENKNADIKELQATQKNITKIMQVDQDNLKTKVEAQNTLIDSKDALIEHEKKICSVLCDSMLARLDWTVVQRRKDGTVNFNQTWSEYRQGFGNRQGEFFLGLEKLHLLTRSHTHELFIYLRNFENKTRFARYDNFSIGHESESFKIKSLGKYTGNAGDALKHHNGMKFSTIDRENDLSEFNCAAVWSSGWWFKKCYLCNLNGVYRDESSSLDHGINWYTWKEEGRLSFVQIMIKRL